MEDNNYVYQSKDNVNDINLAKKYLLIAINIFFVMALIPSIYFNTFVLSIDSTDHYYLALFEVFLLVLSIYTLYYIFRHKEFNFPAYMDSFIMFGATIAVIITTEGDAYGYAFTVVFGITVFTLLKKIHAIIFYSVCLITTVALSLFIFETDTEGLFNLYIILIMSGGILYAFNFSQQDLINKLATASRIDSLTGLWNRKMYYELLQKEIDASLRNKSPLTIMIADIDHFKNVNDTYGHHTGDEYLKYISEFFLNQKRKSDTVARWGGEEFSIILPNTTIENASIIAENIVNQLQKTTHSKVGKVTVSIGITSYIPGEDYNDLFKRADKALYLSKENGRNRFTVI